MGLKTLTNFRDLIKVAVGGRNPGDFVMNSCVNAAVLDVPTAVDIPELDGEVEVTTTIGQNHVLLPNAEDVFVIKLVWSSSLNTKLEYMELGDILSHDFTDTGPPIRWGRHGSKIFMHPKPTASINHTIYLKNKPIVLASDSSVTNYHEMWDYAVELFAIAHAFDIIGEQDRGQYWRTNAVQYCMTRLTEGDFQDRVSGLSRAMPALQRGVQPA